MAERFVRNPAFEHELLASPDCQTAMAFVTAGVAKQVKLAAEPFRGEGERGGYFIRKIRTHRNRVLLRDSFAHLVEFGSANNPPQANARRGVQAAGLRFADDGAKQAE